MSSEDQSIETLQAEVERLTKKIAKMEKHLAMSNAAFLNIVGKSSDGIVILDKQKMVVYTNYAAIKLFDRNIADLLGEPLDILVDIKTSSELQIPHADGTVAVAEVSILETEWNNEPCYLASFRDITERKRSEELLTYMSRHDYLTDLPNRVYFEKKLTSAMADAKKNNTNMALLYIDLDNFKFINDTMGHDAGDLLLKEVSEKLKACTRQVDTVARLGGDEFAVILSSLKRPDYAAQVARKILDALCNKCVIKGKEIFANASVGIAVYPMGGENPVDLLKNADTAMYSAKNQGKNQYRYFSEELNESNSKNMIVLNSLRSINQDTNFHLLYQPLVNLSRLSCYGAEALLRWNHPELGLLAPDEFLPLAEEGRAITQISRWVIEHAFTEIAASGMDRHYFSLNLSAKDLDDASLTQFVYETAKHKSLALKRIVFELTETSVLSNPTVSLKHLDRLHDLGVRIAIDDYGTGYSSLSYIRQMPIAILKIDASFIQDIGKSRDDTIIVSSTIQLAHNLGLKVVAEGVETKEQLDFLLSHGCDYAQGFYFSEPVPIDALPATMKRIAQDLAKH